MGLEIALPPINCQEERDAMLKLPGSFVCLLFFVYCFCLIFSLIFFIHGANEWFNFLFESKNLTHLS